MFTKDNIKATLNKMLAEWDQNPSVNNSFASLWRLQWQITSHHLENDLDIDELRDLYSACRKTETHHQAKYDVIAAYRPIIAKMIEVYTQMFADKDFSRYEIRYSIEKTLSLIGDRLSEEHLQALLAIYRELKWRQIERNNPNP